MSSARLLLLLQKYLQNTPNEVLLLILDTFEGFNEVECSICDSASMMKDYQSYLENGRKMFKENFREICYSCYYHYDDGNSRVIGYGNHDGFNVCRTCKIPFNCLFLIDRKISCVTYLIDNQCRFCDEKESESFD